MFVENIVEKFSDRIRDDIVNLCDLPRIELFARQKHISWMGCVGK